MEQLKKELNWLDSPAKKGEKTAIKLSVGDRVSVVSLNQRGVIEELPEGVENNPRGIVVVRAGAVKLKVPASDIRRISDGGQKSEKGRGGGNAGKARGPAPVRIYRNETNVFVRTERNTLDLRGERVDAALIKLEQFLDACLLSSISPVMIIHGHGTGAVKDAVRTFLSNSNYVSKFRPGENYEGADGVTVAEL
jgi:DNA mismatch repair protein MutS2